jgi:HD-like signal output (HDOD) protein/CheY-like chemotaxis protein
MKPKVLFVDDETNVLHGLARMLRPLREKWDMAFASGGEEALELLGQESFDVIVTDMRMPGMDGSRLLEQVMKLYPHMVRIVLSGHSDRAMILRSVGAAHQYLAKPCDAGLLVSTVERALSLQELFSTPRVKALVAGLGSLPSLPSLYKQILAELQAPEPSPQKVGEIVARDVAMTAKILQLVNSAFFGLFREVRHPVEAVRYLGIETIKALVLSLHLFEELQPAPLENFCAERLWEHSFQVARAAKRIAWGETQDPPVSEAAFTSGLLHDAGRLLLATSLPERYGLLLNKAREDREMVWQAELAELGASHAEVGAYLLGIWGLPQDIVEATAFHHCPSKSPTHPGGFPAAAAVHVAETLLQDPEEAFLEDWKACMDQDYLMVLGRLERLPDWEGFCCEIREKAHV